MRHIRKIFEADAWQASAWMLERKWHDEFGRRQLLENIGKDGGPINMMALDPKKLSDSALAEILGAAKKDD
jgi:hypothetical protein